MRPRTLIVALLLAAVAWPAAASAQYVSTAHGPVWDRFSLEPYAGRYYDNAGTAASGFNDHGWIGGLRLGLAVADRFRLIANVAYAQVDGVARVGGTQDYALFGSQTWLVTGGAEADLIPGDTRGSLSLQGGKAWRDLRQQDVVGQPDAITAPAADSPVTVLVPGFAIRQRVAPRADLMLGVQNYIFVGEDPVSHNWALTAGITLR
jgi:hypothetical protein